MKEGITLGVRVVWWFGVMADWSWLCLPVLMVIGWFFSRDQLDFGLVFQGNWIVLFIGQDHGFFSYGVLL